MHSSPLVLSVIHFISEGYQVCQVQLAACKSMLTTANHLVLNMFGIVFQNLLYNLARAQGEAHKSIVSLDNPHSLS